MHPRTCLVNSMVILTIVSAAVSLTAQEAAPAAPAAAAAPAAVVEPPAVPAAPAAVVAPAAVAAPATPAVETPAAPAVAAPAGVSPAITVIPGSQLISVTLDDVPLPDVVKLFTKISGANIIAATTNLTGSVTANLQDVAWRPAFEAILERQGLLLVEKPADSGIFVVEARRAGEDPRMSETVPLKFAKVDNLAKLLSGLLGKDGTATPFPEGNAILLQASQQKITEARKVIEALDKPRSQVYIEARFVEMSAAASKQLGVKWEALKDWGVTVKGLSAGAEFNKGQPAKYKSGTTEIIQDVTREFHTTTMVPDLSQPVTVYDPVDPSKILSVTYPYMVPQDVVSYPYKKEADLYTTPDGIVEAPGAGRLAEDMAWKSASGIQGQISATDFRLAMSAFEQINGISLISNPKIIVANEEVALIDMTTKDPYVLVRSSRNTTSGGNTYDLSTELGTIPGKTDVFVGDAFFSYGVTLKVTPRVSSAGIITVTIEPSLSSLKDYYVIQGASADVPLTRYPIINIQRIKTMFSMQDGATAVIGGLTRSGESNIDSGIPYLRKIPYIGPRLFGWKSRNKEQTELVIFVTVGIIDPEKPIDENIGMPKNAMLTRDLKEPSDGTKEDMMLLKP